MLYPGDAFIDFIAVSHHARGKGVGSLLMRWAEATAAQVMLCSVPQLAEEDKCRILLRVSALSRNTELCFTIFLLQPVCAGNDCKASLSLISLTASSLHSQLAMSQFVTAKAQGLLRTMGTEDMPASCILLQSG